MKEASALKTNIGKLLKKVENEKVLRDIQLLLNEKSGKSAGHVAKDLSITFTGLQERSGKTSEN